MSELYPQSWRSENELARYPFADTATLVSPTGAQLGTDLLLDAIIHPAGGTGPYYISSVETDGVSCTVWIGDTTAKQRCSGTFTIVSPPDNVELLDAAGRPAGLLVSETLRLSRFQNWAPCTHTFTRAATEFVPSVCVSWADPGVQGFVDDAGVRVAGHVWLVGRNGVVVSQDDSSTEAAPVIRIDVVGEPLFKQKLCTDQGGFTAINYLQTVNNIPPSTYGEWSFVIGKRAATDNVIRITTQQNTLHFELAGRPLE